MDEREFLAQHFEEHRTRLRAVAYRMLGSLSEADDAVQETWLRLSRTDADEVENLGGWLTTVVARVSLNMLRSRRSRREEPLGVRMPDPIVDRADGTDPEHEALLADAVGLALLVVLETLNPAERLAFVLHDMFAVPFDEIAPIVDRSPEAARQLASRARRRVQGEAPIPDADLDTQREVLEAFLAAAREGDFDALLEVLDPDVVLRADRGAVAIGSSRVVRGAANVARQALAFPRLDVDVRPALVNGAVGTVTLRDGRPFCDRGLHDPEPKDRRDGRPRRPRAPQPARPDDPRLRRARRPARWSSWARSVRPASASARIVSPDGTGCPPLAAAEAPERHRCAVGALERDRDPPHRARAARRCRPASEATVGSWTTRWAPPSRSAPQVAVPGLAGGSAPTEPRGQLGIARDLGGDPAQDAPADDVDGRASATHSSASAHSGSSPGASAAGAAPANDIVTIVPGPSACGAASSACAGPPTSARP